MFLCLSPSITIIPIRQTCNGLYRHKTAVFPLHHSTPLETLLRESRWCGICRTPCICIRNIPLKLVHHCFITTLELISMVCRFRTLKAVLFTVMSVGTLAFLLIIQNHHSMINISSRLDPIPITTKAPQPPPQKYLIYYCDKLTRCLGWGDRQRGIMSAYVMAMATNRTFGIIMTKPCLLTKFFVPNQVNWNVNMSDIQHRSAQYFDLNSNDMFTKTLNTVNLEALFHADVIYLVTNRWYINPLLKNSRYRRKLKDLDRMSWRKSFAKVMDQMFRHSNYMNDKIESTLKRFIPNNTTKLVCSQIRLGTNPTIPLDFRVRNKYSSVSVVWKFLQRYSNSTYKIFVSTDSQTVRMSAKKLFAKQIVDVEGAIVHVDSYEPGQDEFACGGFEKALLDQHILSLCDILVISRGGFGFNAIYVRKKNSSVYIFHDGKVKPLDCNKSQLCY
ncbi:uncharacterized protein LOC115215375 isoform X1 [Octopus sinensis]|uniref:Uncharacterized protein LOC115215375 isoform X1 n=2 Tax=Octopus sinensis TaxID=2607531 RepID=A0A7E6F2Y2_9MOLL|nr:uncharacterized protein LOC115215375 isoform X1 [Octopus sinensis]